MKTLDVVLRRHGRALVAIIVISTLYGFTRLPRLSDERRAQLAARFRFVQAPLVEPSPHGMRAIRQVHPSLERLSGWISAVGAGVALSDLDGDGLANDVCHVEPRTDQVLVSPAPGSPGRYAPFALDPAPLAYDRRTTAPMGCLPGDLDENGLMDVLVYYWGRAPIAMLRKPDSAMESASFVRMDVYPTSGDDGRWFTNAASLADVDGDGHLDVIVGNYFPDGARILDPDARDAASMQHSMSLAKNGGRNRVLLWVGANDGRMGGNRPSVRFEESLDAFRDGLDSGWTLALGAVDLDGDLLPELYIANDFGPDLMLHNRSRPGAVELVPLYGARGMAVPKSKVLGRDSFKGMGVDFADIDGNGHLDIYVSNIAAEYALQESHFLWRATGDVEDMQRGIAPYEDASEPLGLSRSDWSWDARLADFDNDGVLEAIQATGFLAGHTDRWPELQELATGNDELLANPHMWPRFQLGDDLSGHVHNPFFVYDEDECRYFDLARDIGVAQPMVTRGIAIADVDGDGDLDYAVANQWETSYLYRNEAPAPGAFLGLHVLLPVTGALDAPQVRAGHPTGDIRARPAIGALVSARVPDGRRFVAHVDGGSGHSGKRSPEVHIGLGAIAPDSALAVTIRWRSNSGPHEEHLTLTPGWHTVLLGTRGEHRDAHTAAQEVHP